MDEGEKIALIQYDPLDDNMPSFLANTERIAYFTISKEDLKKMDFSKVEFEIR